MKYTDAQTVSVQRLIPLTAPSSVSNETWARVFTTYLGWAKRLGMR